MKSVSSLDELAGIIAAEPFVLVYLSRPECGVCVALRPKITELIARYRHAVAWYVDLDALPEAAGQHEIFTIPGILVFVDGKETIREARYISVDDLESRLDRLHGLRFEEGYDG